MVYRNEQELWNKLYRSRTDKLARIYSRLEIAGKSQILDSLENLVEKLSSNTTSNKGPSSLNQYFKEIENDQTVVNKIKQVMNKPDKKQVERILSGKKLKKVAADLNMNYYTLVGVKNEYLREDITHVGYNAAKFAHYLLNKGYRIQ